MTGSYTTDIKGLTFHDAVPRFRDGTDTPRAYLERCLETIAAREPVVQAFAAMNAETARAAADASTARPSRASTSAASSAVAKTTLPLAMYVRTDARPAASHSATRSFMGSLPVPPTLMARRKAARTGMGAAV